MPEISSPKRDKASIHNKNGILTPLCFCCIQYCVFFSHLHIAFIFLVLGCHIKINNRMKSWRNIYFPKKKENINIKCILQNICLLFKDKWIKSFIFQLSRGKFYTYVKMYSSSSALYFFQVGFPQQNMKGYSIQKIRDLLKNVFEVNI